MHGDFTPWNLRRLAVGTLVLLDWEEAAWGPPAADEVLYRATAAALHLERPLRLDAPETIRFWEDRVGRRPALSERDRRMKEALLAALDNLAA
jgi:aminoglycoside phosphotransferase (APT) family kinase protein